jgi:hypothetical protein
MSTQRRENGTTPATIDRRRGARDRRQPKSTDQVGGLSLIWFMALTWLARVIAAEETAPLCQASRLGINRSATESLQSDYRTIQLVRKDVRRIARSSPPLRAVRSANPGMPATRRLSSRLTPMPSVIERLHPFRPQTPAGKCRWTERYDGKRDLHFQYAA